MWRNATTRYRSSKADDRRKGSCAATTPLADERRELLVSLAQIWATKELPVEETDVLDGDPAAVTPGLPRRPRTAPRPALHAWGDWLMLVASGLLVGAFLLFLMGLEI